VTAILKSLEAIPLRITYKHIKSHQDNEERTNILKLSWEAQQTLGGLATIYHQHLAQYKTATAAFKDT
jgi:hypothetical protein